MGTWAARTSWATRAAWRTSQANGQVTSCLWKMILCSTTLAVLLVIGGVEKNSGPGVEAEIVLQVLCSGHDSRGELSYLAPLGSENISAPYFKQCFFRGGWGVLPTQTVKHHASQSQDRYNKYFILYIEFCINNKI